MPAAVRKSRLPMWQTVFDATQKWLAENGYTRKQPSVRSFLDRWTLRMDQEQFLIDPPSRLRFFLFLIRQNHAYSGLQTWRLTTFNYLCALSALLLGYNRAQRFYNWRGRGMETIQRLFGKSLREAR